MSGELSTPKRKLMEAQLADAQIETEVGNLYNLLIKCVVILSVSI